MTIWNQTKKEKKQPPQVFNFHYLQRLAQFSQ